MTARTSDAPRLPLPVKGMRCAACVSKVERALRSVPGVRDAAVTPESREQEQTERVRETERLRRKLVVGAILSPPVLVGGMPELFPWAPGWLRDPRRRWALATPVQFWVGGQFHAAFPREIRHRTVSMNTLVSIGTSAAYFFSVAVTPHAFMATGAMPYFVASALLTTLLVLGRWLEARARGGTSEAIRRLVARQPRTARLVSPSGERDVAIAEVVPGDLLRVRPGERIAVDGEVVEGMSGLGLRVQRRARAGGRGYALPDLGHPALADPGGARDGPVVGIGGRQQPAARPLPPERAVKGARDMARDPVCQMDVDPKSAAAQSKYQGQTYYFCAEACKSKFDSDPAKYLGR